MMHQLGKMAAEPSSDVAQRGVWQVTPLFARWCHVWGFFFFFFFPFRLALTRLDSCQLGFNSGRTEPIRPKSGCIGHGLKHLIKAKISLESSQNSRNRLWGTNFPPQRFYIMCECVCVCVRERERERDAFQFNTTLENFLLWTIFGHSHIISCNANNCVLCII